MHRVETAERAAMAERLETSYKQIRDYQETLHQSQEQMEGAQAILDTSQVPTTLQARPARPYLAIPSLSRQT